MLIKNLDILKGISYNCLLSFKGTTFLRNCKIFLFFFAFYVKNIDFVLKKTKIGKVIYDPANF